MTGPVLARRAGEVVATRPLGAYRQLSVVLPTLSTPARPGQFVTVPSGRADRVLPRTWWICGEHTEAGFGSTLELVVPDHPDEDHPDADGALPEPGDSLAVSGPIGRGFGMPTTAVSAVVVTQGAAGAVGRWLAERLRAVGCSAHLVSCAHDPDLHVDLVQARRSADGVVLTEPHVASGVVADLTQRTAASVLYAVGPISLSRMVAGVASQLGRVSQVSGVEIGAAGVCGHGLCGGCDLPLAVGLTGRERGTPAGARIRPCSDGPVLRGDLVAWESLP